LRQPAIQVAYGVTVAASAHIRSLIARLRVINHELYEANRKLDVDELCAASDQMQPPANRTM
jgi:hypothetical protein